MSSLRLVFTSDGVVVGVVIRSEEQYNLVKIRSRTLILLMFAYVLQKRQNKPMTMFDSGLSDWLVLPLLL